MAALCSQKRMLAHACMLFSATYDRNLLDVVLHLCNPQRMSP